MPRSAMTPDRKLPFIPSLGAYAIVAFLGIARVVRVDGSIVPAHAGPRDRVPADAHVRFGLPERLDSSVYFEAAMLQRGVKMPYTADPRVLFAAERTLLAWQRSAIALMGFGFVVERFGLFLEMLTHQRPSGAQRSFSLSAGVVLLVLGATVALVSARQFRAVATGLAPKVVPPGYWTQIGVALN